MLNKLHELGKDMCYIHLKHETLFFQIQFINLLYSSEKVKLIKSKVALERCLSFQNQKCVITEPKKSHQPKLYPQNKSSVAKKEKSKK